MTTKGFKAMNSDMTCRGFKFKVGNTYEVDSIELCSKGFHFCENLFDVYSYYPKEVNTVICEIEAVGDTEKDGYKSVTSKIKIIRKLDDRELLQSWIKRTNSGYENSGDGNSGNRNSGDGNSADGNSGNRNSGDRNSGDGNSGYENSGDWNSGYRNSGDWNSGGGNSGDGNSGGGNSGDGNSGYFNTESPVYFFNKPSKTKYTKELENKIRALNVKPILTWVTTSTMTETEQTEHPEHKTTGGFLRKTDRYDWRYLTDSDKAFIKSLPNFDDKIFQKISNGVTLGKCKKKT